MCVWSVSPLGLEPPSPQIRPSTLTGQPHCGLDSGGMGPDADRTDIVFGTSRHVSMGRSFADAVEAFLRTFGGQWPTACRSARDVGIQPQSSTAAVPQ
jgi:hypothetical protein